MGIQRQTRCLLRADANDGSDPLPVATNVGSVESASSSSGCDDQSEFRGPFA
jgi:hypothetical protein